MNLRIVTNHSPSEDAYPHLVIEKGKKGLGVGSWVVEQKYKYLCTYIDAARSALNRWPNKVYIDPFCGPGRIQVRDESFTRPNGAVTAWLQSLKSNAPFSKILIGDIASDRVEACSQRLEACGATVEFFCGPASETVLKMVEAVPKSSLCLVYIDPYNLELLSFDIIQTLAQLPNVDFVVHFSTMDLSRNVDHEIERGRFDDVCPNWQQKVGVKLTKKNMVLAFFEFWQNQIQALGYEFSNAMPLVTNDSNNGIYKLVFFAKHSLPLKLWKDVARGPNLDLFM